MLPSFVSGESPHLVVVQLWKALDFKALKWSLVSYFDNEKQETAISRWARAKTRASKVGKGLSKSEKAQKLALPYWREALSLSSFNCNIALTIYLLNAYRLISDITMDTI
ncbi:hypothetical protein AgCh_023984 [Apium graveolens]